jgi:glycogen synthase
MSADTVGGVWNYSISLIRALAPYGIEVILATMGRPPSANQRHQVQSIRNLYLESSNFKLEWMDDPWTEVTRAGDWLLAIEARWRPAIIHLNGYSHAALAWRAPAIVVAHSCVLSWWDAVRPEPIPARWKRYEEQVTAGLCAAKMVIAPTAAMLADLRRLYRWNGNGVVIWNGLGPRNRGCDRKEKLILTVGRFWDEAKNLRALESVASQVSWPIYAAGEAEVISENSQLKRLGHLSAARVWNWMRRASVYALPARYEPFGLSILEAALSGCALVVGDIPSLRELWDGAARFVMPDDIAGLCHELTSLIADQRLREDFAARARRRACLYGLERMAKEYVSVYQNVLEDSSPR